MTQPERPGRAADASMSPSDRHLADQLRRAAGSYEPDGERIRRLIDAKSVALGGTALREPRRQRGLPGRAVLWPAVGSAAAAAVILAVAAAGDVTGQNATPGTTGPRATSTVAAVQDSRPPDSTIGDAAATDAATSASPAPTAGAHPGKQPGRGPAVTVTTTPGTGSGGQAGPGAGSQGSSGTGGGAGPAVTPIVTPPGSGGTSAPVSALSGGRQLTATVETVPAGQKVTLGQSGQAYWLAVNSTANPPHAAVAGMQLLELRPLGNRRVAEPGPFSVTWQNGTPAATGTSGTWVTAPGEPNEGVRVGVRFRATPSTIVLSLGTVNGGGRLEVSVGGAPEAPLVVNLPTCAGTCAYTVTLTLKAAQANVPATGDLTAELFAVGGASARAGVAAAVLK